MLLGQANQANQANRTNRNERVGTVAALVAAIVAIHLTGSPQLVARVRAADGDTQEYREAVRLGLAEYDGQNYLEARAQFLRAHEIFPNARTLRALGLAEFALHNYPIAIGRLEGSLASNVRPLDPDLRRSVTDTLATARHYVDRVVLQVEPRSASVWVDGLPMTLTDGVLLLSVGDHMLEFRMPARQTEYRRLIVQGGAAQVVEVTLAPALLPQAAPRGTEPLDQHTASSTSATRARHAEARWYQSPWFWAALGVVVAGGVAGTVVALTSGSSDKQTGQASGVVLTAPP